MTWLRFDDKRAMHRKLRAAGLAATGLDSAAICQCGADESDGFVSDDTLELIGAAYKERHIRKLAAILCSPEVERWERDDERGGYWIKDYLVYNPSHADLESKREADRIRKQHRSDADSTSKRDGFQPDSNRIPTGSDADSTVIPSLRAHAGDARPIPSHPDPSQKESAPRTARTRKTPIPSGPLPDGLRQWAIEKGFGHLDLNHHWERMLDWHRKEGKLSADWAASWRTWMGREKRDVVATPPTVTAAERAANDRRQKLESTLAAAKLSGDYELESETLSLLEATA